MAKKKLSDILKGGKDLASQFAAASPALEYGRAVPRGEYRALVVAGEVVTSRQGTPGYKLTFKISEGEHCGRLLWHDIWLTPAAMSLAKRDLGKLGVVDLEQLDQPVPPGMRCRVVVVLRREDDGTEHNEIRTFDVIGLDPPQPDPFAPLPETDPDTSGGRALHDVETAVAPIDNETEEK